MGSITMVKVLVTGSNGQLGKSFQALQGMFSNLSFIFLERNDLDLSQTSRIHSALSDYDFDVLLNCAAYTAVDKAETEKEMADAVNHRALAALAVVVKEKKAKLIHFSTDYVFNGEACRPYREQDTSSPQSVYGLTKLNGEKALLSEMAENAMIIRTSWVYSEYGNNFVKTMLRLGKEKDELGVIFDQVGTPTYAKDLAEAVLSMIGHSGLQKINVKSQVFHYSNEGVCSWFDFAKAIFELTGCTCRTLPIETKDYPTPARRPFYSVMNKSKVKEYFGLTIPYWRDGLKKCLKELEKSHGM